MAAFTGPKRGLDKSSEDAGTVYRVDAGSTFTVVNQFDGADGYRPVFPMLRLNGDFYETAPQGGLLDFQGGDLFRLTPNGNVRVLHSFTTHDTGGIIPNAALVQGADGLLYGTAGLGGVASHGTLFRIDPADLGPVASVSVKPDIIKSGDSATGKVKLFDPAPEGGTVVTLGAKQGQVVIPPNVTVPAGQTVAKFTVGTMQINQPVNVRLYASVAGQGTRTTVTVTP